MSTTAKYEGETQIVSTAWTTVSTNKGHCFLQIVRGDPVLVHVGGVAPDISSTVGLIMERTIVNELSLGNLESGDNVYVRALIGNADLVVITPTASIA